MRIVYKIVEYLEGCNRYLFSPDIDSHNKCKAVLTPLLSISECWRVAALDSTCDNCQLDFNTEREAIEIAYPAWLTSFSYLGFRKNHLVKQVVVAATLWADMRQGKFSQVMARPQYESLVFSSATSLVLRMCNSVASSSMCDSYVYTCNKETEIQGNVATIARSLLHLTPAAFRITVSVISGQGMQYYHGGYYNRPTDLGNLYSKIAMELCQGGARSLLVESQLKELLLSIDMGAISGLTNIAHGPDVSCVSFAKLAYLNAPTLKMLDMRLAAQTEWAILIYGRTTTSAAYPNLASLTLAISGISYSVTWAATEDAAPFPVLSKLSVSGGYPFDDDLLFRGNGGTMMSLCIPFSAIARNALGRFGVLKCGDATQMTKVSIDEVTSLDKEFLAGRTDVPIKQQVHGILEVARSLSTKDYTMGFPVYKALCVATSTAILQRLDFLDELIRVDGIISLVAAIPSLVSLVCSVASIGTEIGAILENRRLSSLYAKHYPLSANFRVLQVSNTADSKIEDMAYTAMLLAVLCPNFACVDISPSLRNAFGRGVAWAAFNFPFEEHADTLRRLIYRK